MDTRDREKRLAQILALAVVLARVLMSSLGTVRAD
jgi:hypothetical protein